MIKCYFKALLYMLGIIIGLTIMITVFNYYGILNGSVFKILKIVIPIFAILYASFIIGKSSNKKGYIEGIKFGIVAIIVFIILNLILGNSIAWKNLIYFLILLTSSMLGSMIGINKKKTE